MTNAPEIEAASPKANAPNNPLRKRIRPLTIGLSVGHAIGTVGSLGFFAGLPRGRRGIVSTASVLWPKGAKVGDRVHQPGRADNDVLTATTRIATLLRTALSEQGGAVTIDAAVAEILDQVEIFGNVIPELSAEAGRPLGQVATLDGDDLGREIAFVGRTSGYSRGLISGIGINNLEIERHTFNGCIEITGSGGRVSSPGDSGALVYRRKDCAPVGLIFAHREIYSRSISYALPISSILEALNVTFLPAY